MTNRVRASILAITFAALFALPTVAAAQDPVSIGVLAGVNFAKLDFDDDDDDEVENLVAWRAGAFLQNSINASTGWRLEAALAQKGAKFEGSDDGKIKLTYVDVAGLLMFGPSSSGDTRFHFLVGPQVSFKTNAKLEENGVSVDFDDNVKGTDVAAVLGVGFESGRFGADLRYAHGFTNIAEGGSNVKNRVISANVSVKLR